MTGFPLVETPRVEAALRAAVPRLASLVRSIRRPDAPALGAWSAGEVATHLTHAWETLPAMARAERGPLLRDRAHPIEELSGVTRSMVRAEGPTDPGTLADRLEAAAGEFLADLARRPAGATGPWLLEGVAVSLATFACHLLNESLVHGFDIARVERAPWPIDPAHAGVALMGFVFPMLAMLDPRAAVVQEEARGLRARFEVRVRRTGRAFLSFDDGAVAVAPEPAGPVDCHVSAHPTALFLVIWNRRSQWPAVGRGQLLSWGRRPWLGLRLRSLLANP